LEGTEAAPRINGRTSAKMALLGGQLGDLPLPVHRHAMRTEDAEDGRQNPEPQISQINTDTKLPNRERRSSRGQKNPKLRER
jgi:hypothetical protein